MLLEKRKEDVFRDEVVRQLNDILRVYEDVEVKPKANLWYRLQMKDDGTRDLQTSSLCEDEMPLNRI